MSAKSTDMSSVVTYQLAYLSHREVDLCHSCVDANDHDCGALGPVSMGEHRGHCDGARHVTDSRIEALSTSAGEHGDLEQVALCKAALAGDVVARAQCERAIRDSQAQEDRP